MYRMNKIIGWKEHSSWFGANLNTKSQCLIICTIEQTSQKVAAVRFDVNGTVAIVSINLAPLMRSKRLSVPCLSRSISYFTSKFGSVSIIEAEIKPLNIASIKTFESVGFVFEKEDNEIQHYKFIV